MLLKPRIAANEDESTATQYPWCLLEKGKPAALFAKKSIGNAFINACSKSRQLEDDASRYRAMYLSAATYMRSRL